LNLYSQTYQQLPLISAPKIHVDLLWDLSILFVSLALVYFIFIFFYRNRLKARRRREKQRKRELSPMISEFLFHEDDASKDEKSNYVNLKIEIRQLIKDDFNRRVLSEVLLDLRKDVSGAAKTRLFKLYQELGLHNDDFKRLKSWRWEIISKGVLNLTQMQVSQAYSFLTKFINDKRPTIRKQAEIAVVTLKKEGINYFLDNTKGKISEWQQLKLIDALRIEEDFEPPQFKAWLTSTNRYVVLFALRLMKFYNQNGTDNALIELVKHKSNQIKAEAIACIKEFHIAKALPMLKLVFWKSSVEVKISILNAIAVLGNESDIEFLKLIEKKESNFLVRSKAHSSINTISPGSIMPSKGLVNTSNYEIPEDIEIEEQIEAVNTKETVQVSDKVNEVLDEIKEQNSEVSEDKTVTNIGKENQEIEFLDIENLNYNFLPLVTKPEHQFSDDKNSTKVIDELQVNFEEVRPEKEIPSTKKKISSIEITEEEIAFLPIVTDVDEEPTNSETTINEIEVQFEEIKNTKKRKVISDYSEYSKPEILEVGITYEEIREGKENLNEVLSDVHHTLSSSKNLLDNTLEASQTEDSFSEKAEQKFQKIIKEFFDFNAHDETDETNLDSLDLALLEFDDDFAKPIDTKETPLGKQNESKIEVKDKIEETHSIIPKMELSDDVFNEIVMHNEGTEESRLQLLDDIAEMGDYREIPLLKEFLRNENYKTVEDRIAKLIEKFSESIEKPVPQTMSKSFNVFKDLFKTCDTHSKLILMDEIVAVGDEAEISFLEELLEDKEKKISAKAAIVLEELKLKLSNSNQSITMENSSSNVDAKASVKTDVPKAEEKLSIYDSLLEELQIEPSQEHEMFDIDFEMEYAILEAEEHENHENESIEENVETDSIVDQLLAFSNKIIDKLGG